MLGLARGKTFVIDFATLADGRIVALLTSGLLTGKVIVPDVKDYEAAHHALLERARTALEQLKADRNVKVQVTRANLEGEELFKAAKRLRARVITAGDGAAVPEGVAVTELNKLHEALRPVYLPGAELLVKIVKKGKEADEGIGYLDGGIKVVVDDGSGLVGKEANVIILGSLDTAVGRVVFARPKYAEIR